MTSKFRLGCVLFLLIGCAVAFAQSNNSRRQGNYQRQRSTTTVAQSNDAPGPEDFGRFSGFIAQRNIFDPNRYPRNSRTSPPTTYRPRTTRSAPTFTLVGTMSYEKGLFAFFDGNNSELRKVLPETGGIAGYKVTEVTLTGVTLQTADKKETVKMKIGEAMRQEGDHWLPAGRSEMYTETGSAQNPVSGTENSSSPEASAAPTSASEPNDILKKLMQQREQELK